MRVNGLNVGLNMPTALASIGSGETEMVHTLPPYHRRKAFLVDEYPACPPEWLRSSGRIKSYFVPMIENNGLWLDFNECLNDVPQNVAIVISVQGVNAVTGLPCKDPQLEQYKDECPKHKKPFGPDRLCPECGYKWPKQNYVASAATPEGSLWLDGFRAEDGKVRQYVLTAQKERGVAKAVIGEDRVHALGISFFLTKEKRPERPTQARSASAFPSAYKLMAYDPGVDTALYDKSYDSTDSYIPCAAGPTGVAGPAGPDSGMLTSWTNNASVNPATSANLSVDNAPLMKAMAEAGVAPDAPPPAPTKGGGIKRSGTKGMADYSGSLMRESVKISASSRAFTEDHARHLCSMASVEPVAANFMSVASAAPVRVKKLEIAAGARIDQQVYPDALSLDAYQAEPEGIIVINYCAEAEAEAILAAGKIDLSGSKEGFLKNVPTGNPV